MLKLKEKLMNRFLPTWAIETLKAELDRQKEINSKLLRQNEALQNYCDGLEYGLKRKIIINCKESDD